MATPAPSNKPRFPKLSSIMAHYGVPCTASINVSHGGMTHKILLEWDPNVPLRKQWYMNGNRELEYLAVPGAYDWTVMAARIRQQFMQRDVVLRKGWWLEYQDREGRVISVKSDDGLYSMLQDFYQRSYRFNFQIDAKVKEPSHAKVAGQA